jgi:hypothetical protein
MCESRRSRSGLVTLVFLKIQLFQLGLGNFLLETISRANVEYGGFGPRLMRREDPDRKEIADNR